MKVFVLSVCFILIGAFTVLAGEFVTLPYDVVVSEPLTDQGEKVSIKIHYLESGNHYADIEYNVWNQDRTKLLYGLSFQIRNIPDNINSVTSGCVAEEDPWELCTGDQTCTNDCDESTTDFTDFVAGFSSTLNSRASTAMSQDLQSKLETQAKP